MTSTAPPGTRGSTGVAVRRGLALHRAGRIVEAETLARGVVTLDDYAQLAGGDLAGGEAAYRAALATMPNGTARSDAGVPLRQTGRVDEAEPKLEQALEREPELPARTAVGAWAATGEAR